MKILDRLIELSVMSFLGAFTGFVLFCSGVYVGSENEKNKRKEDKSPN